MFVVEQGDLPEHLQFIHHVPPIYVQFYSVFLFSVVFGVVCGDLSGDFTGDFDGDLAGDFAGVFCISGLEVLLPSTSPVSLASTASSAAGFFAAAWSSGCCSL